jgi:hypothetical protein
MLPEASNWSERSLAEGRFTNVAACVNQGLIVYHGLGLEAEDG